MHINMRPAEKKRYYSGEGFTAENTIRDGYFMKEQTAREKLN